MDAKIVRETQVAVTIEVTVLLEGAMLDVESRIQDAMNEAGMLATEKALEKFDADGTPIQVGGVKFTSKGKYNQKYETPYGKVDVLRHLYQNSVGGKTLCPMEHDARTVLNATPRFAKIVSGKYAQLPAPATARDMESTSNRTISIAYIQNLAEAVGTIAMAKEEDWEYELPSLGQAVRTIAVGVDGTCTLLRDDGWRVAMTGTISLYNKDGERLHTTYVGAAPEYGKAEFHTRMDREINRIVKQFPKATIIGLGDGAIDNWSFLSPYVDHCVLDFYHAAEYVKGFASAYFGNGKRSADAKEEWIEDHLHRLKHKHGHASRLLKEMTLLRSELTGNRGDSADRTLTYFTNHKDQMRYAARVASNQPIGSGVTEAACKTLVKQRLGVSGARWSERSISIVLSIRSLVLTANAWNSFWRKFSRYGIPRSIAV
jgi:hypothetical protein